MARPHRFETAPAAGRALAGPAGGLSRTRIAFLGLAALVLVALGVHFWSGGAAPQGHDRPAPPVEIAHATQKDVTVAEHTIGTVVANASVNVTSQVAGQVVSAGFKEGQIVHKGDVLFRLDPRPFEAALTQARANLARDQAQLSAALRDQKRYETLFQQKAISAQQRDQAGANAGALAGTVKADKAAVAIAQLNLDYATITSPVDGKTGPILIQPGNLVKANDSNPLVVVTQIQPIKVSFFLPQTDLPRIQAQMRANRLIAEVSAHGDPTVLKAPVDFVGNQVNNQTGTIELRATFANRDARLVPGELVDVTVGLTDLKNATVVPSDAVNQGPNGQYVFVVDNSDTARMVPVTVAYDSGEESAVRGKLKPGDRVITVGQLRVEPGKTVSISGSSHRRQKTDS